MAVQVEFWQKLKMKVALDREMLEEIVGDGMKEMMSRLNLSRSQRKKKWGRNLSQTSGTDSTDEKAVEEENKELYELEKQI